MSEGMDRDLPWGMRMGLKLHLMMCKVCTATEKQLLLLRKMARYWGSESKLDTDAETLSLEARECLRKKLRTE